MRLNAYEAFLTSIRCIGIGAATFRPTGPRPKKHGGVIGQKGGHVTVTSPVQMKINWKSWHITEIGMTPPWYPPSERTTLYHRQVCSHPITQDPLSRSGRSDAPFDSGGTILSAVLKMVAVGDLGDLQRSRGQLSLLQPSYNSGSTVPIATRSTSFDSAYAISSAVSKLVTLGDLCDLEMALRHFCLQQYCSHPITQNLLCRSRRARRHSIQHMRFHQPFQGWWPWVTSVTFRGQEVTFPYCSHPITQDLLRRSRRA